MTADPYTAEIDRAQAFAKRRWDRMSRKMPESLSAVPVALLNAGICLGVMLDGPEAMAEGLETLARDLRAGALNIEKKG